MMRRIAGAPMAMKSIIRLLEVSVCLLYDNWLARWQQRQIDALLSGKHALKAKLVLVRQIAPARG